MSYPPVHRAISSPCDQPLAIKALSDIRTIQAHVWFTALETLSGLVPYESLLPQVLDCVPAACVGLGVVNREIGHCRVSRGYGRHAIAAPRGAIFSGRHVQTAILREHVFDPAYRLSDILVS